MSNRRRKLFETMIAAGMILSLAACGKAEQGKTSNLEDTSKSTMESTQTDKSKNSTNSKTQSEQTEIETDMTDFDFSVFSNVEITGINVSELSEEEQAVLYQQARYCQAMTEADTETMMEITSPDMIFTHMSGRQQTRDEYFADIEDGNLQYFTIDIENPVVNISGNYASVSYTSVLNANAYGARGTYRIDGIHWYEKQGEHWIACNAPKQERDVQ